VRDSAWWDVGLSDRFIRIVCIISERECFEFGLLSTSFDCTGRTGSEGIASFADYRGSRYGDLMPDLEMISILKGEQ
jgi:hypothetical protein